MINVWAIGVSLSRARMYHQSKIRQRCGYCFEWVPLNLVWNVRQPGYKSCSYPLSSNFWLVALRKPKIKRRFNKASSTKERKRQVSRSHSRLNNGQNIRQERLEDASKLVPLVREPGGAAITSYTEEIISQAAHAVSRRLKVQFC